MLKIRVVVSIITAGLMCLGASGVSGQSYPSKPIRFFTSTPGGSSDTFTRLIAQGITAPLGQPIVVENRVAIITSETVAKAPPDGYTIMYHGSGLLFTPLLRKTSYDVLKDFSSITIVATSPNVLVVHPSLPVKSVKDVIALAKARPGELNFSVGLPGTSIHLASELFKSMAGVNVTNVYYKGVGPAVMGLIGGETSLMFADPATAALQVKAGRVRALAITSPGPSALYPGLPTVASTGLPGYEMVTIDAIWAPAGTPPAIINRLNQEIVRVLNQPDVKEKFFNSGAEVAPSTPEQLTAKVKADITSMAKVIKDAGIKLD